MEKDLISPMALSQSDKEHNESGISLGEIIAVITEYKWMIAAITVGGILLGGFGGYVSRPEYRATSLVQVEEQASSTLTGLKEFGSLMGLAGDTTVAAEQEILNSRMVLNKVIERQRLNILAEPKYFPLVGRAISRRYEGGGLASPVLGMGSYAWGGESINVSSLEVPKSMLDKELTLVVKEGGNFDVIGDLDEPVLKGEVGLRAETGKYSIFVSSLAARPGTRFVIVKYSYDELLKAFSKKYSVKERGKKSGIIEISIQGNDPERIGTVLDEILNAYVRQNVDRRSAEAENTLRFLERQLPDVKRQLDTSEAAYNNYRQTRGSLDLNAETQSVLQSLLEVDNQVLAIRQEKDELRQYFTAEHPRVIAADSRIEKLKQRRVQFEKEVSRLPDTQQEILRLARDVEVNTTLYTNLVNTAQQLRVSKAGTVGDVRIIDNASVTTNPISMQISTFLLIGGALGLIVGFGTVWLMRSLRVVVNDPDEIESKLGLPVYASIPHSRDEVAIAKRNKTSKVGELLAISSPEDDAVESLRSLRTTIHFALLDANRNSLLITGASPGLGKSFISTNLGAVLAQAGKRIVIVDADLRRGHINKEFGLKREVGVSEYVANEVSLDEVIKPTTVPNLWVVTTGQIPPNPSELLMHMRFEELLDKLMERFDTMIVDAPPVLAVSDAAIIARHMGATLMVARAGRHPIQELAQALKRLRQSAITVKGFIFNDLDTNRQRYRYGHKGYVYQYSYKSND